MPFQNIDCRYNNFIKDINVVVILRKNYEVINSFDGGWPYSDQNAFIENNFLNSLEIYVMPILLGDGILLFPSFNTNPRQLKSISAETIQN
jgi:hypothetical protein